MSDELTVCAAAFLRNKGKGSVTENEFLMGISMDLHWMPYKDAKKLLTALIDNRILIKSGEFLKPDFEISGIDVPVAYRPSDALIRSLDDVKTKQAKKDDVGNDMMPLLMSEAVESGMEKRDFISECNVLQKRLNIDVLAAGLIVLRDRGVDVSDYSDRVYDAVSRK